jgi:hypothetical protein
MSESEFHVHGAHEHEMEHASHGSGSSSLAVATAILATLGAVFSYMGGYTQANAALLKTMRRSKKQKLRISGIFIRLRVANRICPSCPLS